MRLTMCSLVLALPLLLGAAAPAPDADPAKVDLAAFQTYLEKNHAGKKWQTGPSRIDSEEVRKAYPNQRFYYVFSAPPLPPGAPLPDKVYQARLEEFRKNFLALTIRIDEQGKITPLQKPQDYNQGLMKVANDDDAKVAAAAILALLGQDRVGPGPVPASEVKVTKNDKGWMATVSKRNVFHGTVSFDPAGRCTLVAKQYAGPLPP